VSGQTFELTTARGRVVVVVLRVVEVEECVPPLVLPLDADEHDDHGHTGNEAYALPTSQALDPTPES
jgi:hypothetical protein